VSEKNGLLNLKVAKQFRKNNFGFVMHEVNAAFLREALRFSMAVARIHQNTATGGLRHSLGKDLPHSDRAEPFVEHDNRAVRAYAGEYRSVSSRFPFTVTYLNSFGVKDKPYLLKSI